MAGRCKEYLEKKNKCEDIRKTQMMAKNEYPLVNETKVKNETPT